MKILCIGDSNTYGYDPRSYTGSRYPAEVRWTDRLKGDLEVINCGMNGAKVPHESYGAAGLIRSNDPDLVIIMLGTNDLTCGTAAEETAERMGIFLDPVIQEGRPVLLISPPLLQFGEWVMDGEILEESRKLGEEYRKLAEEKGCLYADAGKWDIEVTFDGVHFSPEGHTAFAEKMNELLEKQRDLSEMQISKF